MSDIKQRLKAMVDAATSSHAFKLERAILKFTEQLTVRMRQIGIGPSVLAERIEVKPPYISKILRGSTNFTFDSIVKIAEAVEADFVFDLVPKAPNSGQAPIDMIQMKSEIRPFVRAGSYTMKLRARSELQQTAA